MIVGGVGWRTLFRRIYFEWLSWTSSFVNESLWCHLPCSRKCGIFLTRDVSCRCWEKLLLVDVVYSHFVWEGKMRLEMVDGLRVLWMASLASVAGSEGRTFLLWLRMGCERRMGLVPIL